MAAKKGRLVENDNADERVYGPSWYDVYIALKDLQLKWPEDELRIHMTLNTGYNGQVGLRYVVLCKLGTVRGAGCFLGRTAEDSKTAAGAAYRALTRAWYTLEQRDEAKEQGRLEL